ncbi:MAG: hypothetical protein RPR97_07630, partial [Colwellia sp.]
FSLFCVFFAIYLNAQPLAEIFIADKWSTNLEGINKIAGKDWGQWISQVSKIATFAISITFIYGLGQLASALIWGFVNNINRSISTWLNKSDYILLSEYKILEKKQNDSIDRISKKEEAITTMASSHDQQIGELTSQRDKYKSNHEELISQHNDVLKEHRSTYMALNFFEDYLIGKQPTKYSTTLDISNDIDLAPHLTRVLNVFRANYFSIAAPDREVITLKPFDTTELATLGGLIGALESIGIGQLSMSIKNNPLWTLDVKSINQLEELEDHPISAVESKAG